LSVGAVTYQNRCHPPAPSTCAASTTSLGTWRSPAKIVMVTNGMAPQTTTRTITPRPWTGLSNQSLGVIVLVVVWGAIPFVTITIFAGLLQVPSDVVDAAHVDGAGGWQRFWYVTAPTLKPIFLIVTCLSTIWDFGVFNQIYVLLNQRPSSDYFTIAIYSYRESFGVTQYGLGAAIAVVMVLILVVVTLFYVRETVKVAEIA